jgi:hypothetical protein
MYNNFHVCVWSQKASETVSEVVNFKIFLGACPQTSLASVRYRMLEFPPSTKKSCINPCVWYGLTRQHTLTLGSLAMRFPNSPRVY